MELINMELTMINIPISNSQWGDFNIVVPDIESPKWFGPYQTGNISIYRGSFENNITDIPCYALIYVLSEQDMPELNMLGYLLFSLNQNMRPAIDIMYEAIKQRYAEQLINVRNENVLSLH